MGSGKWRLRLGGLCNGELTIPRTVLQYNQNPSGQQADDGDDAVLPSILSHYGVEIREARVQISGLGLLRYRVWVSDCGLPYPDWIRPNHTTVGHATQPEARKSDHLQQIQ